MADRTQILSRQNTVRRLLIGTAFFAAILPCPIANCEDSNDHTNKSILDDVDRKVIKEPKYDSTPRYSLLVLGPKAEAKVWIVEDGKTLYVDKNANGDLTDDGPPIKPTEERNLGSDHWDYNYVLDEIKSATGARHTEFNLRRWNYGNDQDSYGLSITLDGKTPMYAGWFGTLWAPSPEKSQMIHFGGALRPRLLRSKDFEIGKQTDRLSIAFTNPGRGEGATSRLSIDALPKSVLPLVEIEWPVADGAAPLRTTHPLPERCCYWEFYTTSFEVPDKAVPGVANATVLLPTGELPIALETNELKVRVRRSEAEAVAK